MLLSCASYPDAAVEPSAHESSLSRKGIAPLLFSTANFGNFIDMTKCFREKMQKMTKISRFDTIFLHFYTVFALKTTF